ncbi:YHS domain-containing protein [Lipingzhangella halophila]|uniref:YHS domain-containing protein n=1 Tax=Lipingzhangella halophila TaxID=1783352 RepID=A0A7W7W3Z2_9ACTN|nr:hypothetical protein [Lipingzhangella halophila]MBB4932324.1 YHS domain-containing protein [Lipingzhangella halophila]
MFLIEIAHPSGALTDDDRAAVARSIISGLMGTDEEAAIEGVAEETMRRARPMTHVAFRELTGWTNGNGPVSAEAAPPIWVTITVPEAWRDDMARPTTGFVRRAVRRLDNDHGWQRTGGDLWINMVGVADGSIGLNGKPSTADDVLEYMTEEFRAVLDAGRELPEGVLLDPMCGMQVRLDRNAITLDHDGETIGFCAPGCRDAYARRNGITVQTA